MRISSLQRIVTILSLTAGIATACEDASVAGPGRTLGNGEEDVSAWVSTLEHAQSADLDVCPNLSAPAGSSLALRVYANGVQIYRWNGAAWTFVAPSAVLTADAQGRSDVGSHYGGPTWESRSGGKVVGSVRELCTPDPTAVPWLLLDATPLGGPGIFRSVTSIQRINTTGGRAPSTAGSFVGEEARVAYTAEYLFYRSN